MRSACAERQDCSVPTVGNLGVPAAQQCPVGALRGGSAAAHALPTRARRPQSVVSPCKVCGWRCCVAVLRSDDVFVCGVADLRPPFRRAADANIHVTSAIASTPHATETASLLSYPLPDPSAFPRCTCPTLAFRAAAPALDCCKLTWDQSGQGRFCCPFLLFTHSPAAAPPSFRFKTSNIPACRLSIARMAS